MFPSAAPFSLRPFRSRRHTALWLASPVCLVTIALLAGCGGGGGGKGSSSDSSSTGSTTTNTTGSGSSTGSGSTSGDTTFPFGGSSGTTATTTTTTTGGTSTTGTTTTGTTTTGTTTPVNNVDPATGGSMQLIVQWPGRYATRSRLVPVAAESIHFTVVADSANGPAVIKEMTVTRPTDAPSPEPTQITISGLPVQSLTLLATAYPSADATGIAQAKGSVTVPLTQNDYDPYVNFGADSTIDHITLTSPKPQIGISEKVSLSATAYDASGQVVLTRPESLRWQTDNHALLVNTDNLGTIISNPSFGVGTVTVTDSESGKTASLQLAVGYPLHVGLDAQGARSTIPLYSDKRDDTGAFNRVAPNGGSFDWQSAQVNYADVATAGTPVTIVAPATYGDRQFVGWTRDGQDAGTGTSLVIDPTQTYSTALVANYAPRSADSATGEFGPNYLHDLNYQARPAVANQVWIWNLSSTKISILTSGNFTSDLRQNAIDGMNFWVQATSGEFQYTLLPDNDAADADILVAFCDHKAFVPALSTYGFGDGFGDDTPDPGSAGVTYYKEYSSVYAPSSPYHYGSGKRIIYIYTDSGSDTDYLKATAAHELFHALGMSGHSSHPEDLMYGGGNGSSKYRVNYPDERDMNSFLSVLESKQGRAARANPPKTGGKTRTVRIF